MSEAAVHGQDLLIEGQAVFTAAAADLDIYAPRAGYDRPVIPKDERDQAIIALCDEMIELEDKKPFDTFGGYLLDSLEDPRAEQLPASVQSYARKVIDTMVREGKVQEEWLPHIFSQLGVETADEYLPFDEPFAPLINDPELPLFPSKPV